MHPPPTPTTPRAAASPRAAPSTPRARTASTATPLKVLLGFYQIATKVEDVYEVFLPAQVRGTLQQFRVVVSLGIEGVPLACVGANGYMRRLLFWLFAPLVLFAVTASVVLANAGIRQRKVLSPSVACAHVLPVGLRLAFLVYPIVTKVAFEAFSCFEFEDGRGWLVADVAIECDTAEHANAKATATVAILLYPVGILVLTGSLLFRARRDILRRRKTALTRALGELKNAAYALALLR